MFAWSIFELVLKSYIYSQICHYNDGRLASQKPFFAEHLERRRPLANKVHPSILIGFECVLS
jgi:hypothetical protein